jgi:hypothetical protein
MPCLYRHIQDDLPRWILAFLLFVLLFGCASRVSRTPAAPELKKTKELARMGYAIQVGAFSSVGNAARLVRNLKKQRLDSYYFRDGSGLYKVRFGNFPSERQARERADDLQSEDVIEEFYIIKPGDYSVAKMEAKGSSYLRDEIVKTAQGFIGVPYLWGGDSPDEGFDCSGFTMAVYQYNGLNLPRSSKEQYETGAPVDQGRLMKGDLVFFNTAGNHKISHVGLYCGGGKFIHAPGRGKKITAESLSRSYYEKCYAGARTFITP